MGAAPIRSASARFCKRDDEVGGESKGSADAPPRRLRARTQPVNMRATAKQRGCDRGTRSNGCEFVLLIHPIPIRAPPVCAGRSGMDKIKEEDRICVGS